MNRYLIVFGVVIVAIVSQSSGAAVKRAEGNPHDIMTPGQGHASQCLQCRLSDKMSLAECLEKPDDVNKYEECESSRPECMTQLFWHQDKLVFVSECEQIEACIEQSLNEPGFNNCDDPPINVVTKCRYCCNETTLTNGYYCPPPSSPQTCTVHGDPRFHTFDGFNYHEGNDCRYTLLQMNCGTHDMLVEMEESEHAGHWRVETLSISQEGETLNVGVNDGVNPVVFDLDGTLLVNSPHWVAGALSQFHLSEDLLTKSYTITMDQDLDGYFDLVIEWAFRRVELTLSQLYAGCFVVEGLCGNANGSPSDYLTMANGINATTYTEFHQGWGVGGSCTTP